MDINKQLDELIEAIVFSTKLEVSEIEKRLGYAKGRISQAKSKGQVNERLINYIKSTFRDELSGISGMTLNEQTVDYSKDGAQLSMQAIVNLTQSNKVLAESNKILAISHNDLVEMVKKSEHVGSRNQPDELSIYSDLLEVLADVASGKRYGSKKEALAALNRYVGAAAQKKKLKGTRNS